MIDSLRKNCGLTDEDLINILESDLYDNDLISKADIVRRSVYGTDIYIRGLIEFTNYCKNNCYYCGIRRDNKNAERYRLDSDDIFKCCSEGYSLGYRTFVLQGGEDMYYNDKKICSIVYRIKSAYPDCAVTLSIGERSKESYKAFFNAGASRYLLRHETADEKHYVQLHPNEMSLKNRKQCLWDLKEIGYQVGSGFMVGSPYQTVHNIISDIHFLKELNPDMIGIGTYITHKDTPFANKNNGSLSLTIRLVAVLRLMFPHALIPATTALGTIHPLGREMALKAGANVIMLNLSPFDIRRKYSLYDNKKFTGTESAQSKESLEKMAESLGYRIVVDTGDVKRL